TTDLRGRTKSSGAAVEACFDIERRLRNYRQISPVRPVLRGEKPHGNFTLKHQNCGSEKASFSRKTYEDRVRDAVWQVPYDLEWRLGNFRERCLQNIAQDKMELLYAGKFIRQKALQVAIDLNGPNFSTRSDKLVSQRSTSRPNFDHAVAGLDICGRYDLCEN